MNYVINVGRMHLINKWLFIGVPLMIMGSVVVIIMLVGALLVPGNDPFITGAGQAPLWYFLVTGIQALTMTFPFSQGMSITRRNFFLGTTASFAVEILAFSVLFYLLGLVEKANDGWWVGGYVFAIPWVTDGPWYQTIAFVATATFLLFMIGLWAATIYKRWGTLGALVASFGTVLLLLVLAAIATFTESWPRVGRWLISQTSLDVAGWLALLICALGVGSFLTLRRATP